MKRPKANAYNRPKKVKRPKTGAKPAAPSRRKGGGLKGLLSGQPLAGKSLGKAAKALTKLELLPGLKSYQREANAIEQQRAAAEAGLNTLGAQTLDRVKGVYGTLKGASDQTVARTNALAQNLNLNQTAANNQASANLQGFQTGQLGGITEALQAGNVAPGGSASQQALAQQAQAQQQAQTQEGQAQSAFASAQGGAWAGLAAGQAQAAQTRGAESQTDIASLIANRIAESNMTHRAAYLDALGKKADLKATKGASILKNLLQLRQGERDYSLAANPPTKTSRVLNNYKGLNKKGTARAQITVAQLQAKAAAGNAAAQQAVAVLNSQGKVRAMQIYQNALRHQGGGGGGGRRRRR